uniref:Uncharacterized protein n=1 Tax=Oryza sativa subsp. japonica TaxID=39947 RepID=Q6Z634_ORYSJ|nr:hypothetical protein [Oryza sativa Japonica Group]BAD05485.1 hypothetical protein [Oryza sativa Japonica Group]
MADAADMKADLARASERGRRKAVAGRMEGGDWRKAATSDGAVRQAATCVAAGGGLRFYRI